MNNKIYCGNDGCGKLNGASPLCAVICENCGYGKENTTKVPYTLTNDYKLCPMCFHCISCAQISKKEYTRIIGLTVSWLQNMIKLLETRANKEEICNLYLPEEFIKLCKSVGIRIV